MYAAIISCLVLLQRSVSGEGQPQQEREPEPSLKARLVSSDCLSVHLRDDLPVILSSNLVCRSRLLARQQKVALETCRDLPTLPWKEAESLEMGDMLQIPLSSFSLVPCSYSDVSESGFSRLLDDPSRAYA
jgi:hypothetical protein